MNIYKKLELIFDWMPAAFLTFLIGIKMVDSVIPSKDILSAEGTQDALLLGGIFIVFATLQKINKTLRHFKDDGLPVPANYLESININRLISDVDPNAKIVLYIGFLNKELYLDFDSKKLQKLANVKLVYGLNTIDFLCDNFTHEKFNSTDELKISNLPADSIIAVQYSSKGSCTKISILRCYENASGMYALELSPYKDYLNEMSNSYLNRFSKGAISIRNKSMLNFYKEYSNEKGLIECFIFGGEKVDIRNKGELFDRSISLVEKSTVSLKAIDMTPVEKWVEEQIYYDYLDANASSNASLKIRIKIFNKDNVKQSEEAYKVYIDRMKQAGIKLLFLEEEYLHNKCIEERGTVIIDGEALITYMQPKKGTNFGKIDFSDKSILAAENLFTSLKETMNSEEFVNSYLN